MAGNLRLSKRIPGVSASRRKRVIPLCRDSTSVEVRAAQMMTSARSAPLIGPLIPSMRQAPPAVLVARDVMAAKSDPAPGSDMARAKRTSPLTTAGR